MSWDEFGDIVNKLIVDIQEFSNANSIHFDAIAPILRNGAIPGTIIANKLDITTILPIQVKYDYKTKTHVQLLPFYKPLNKNLGESPKILGQKATRLVVNLQY
jgi:hypoxanthine phosphoribosyltransferase